MNSPDHDSLIRFLKEHEPSGPPPSPDHEAELWVRLGPAEPVRFSLELSKKRWWMPAMVAAGLLLTVGHGQLQKAFNTMPEAIVEPSFNMLEAPEAIADHKQDQELEAFLEESWSYSFGEHLYREDRLAGEKVNFVVNTNP